MQTRFERVEAAINDLKNGKMIILTDHPDRENEGDLIIAAEKITPDHMNFLIHYGAGVVCFALTKNQAARLDIPLMVPAHENTSACHTPFGISVDAKNGITTGVSAIDRTNTILTMMRDEAHPADIVKPGHIFPLLANDDGVLARQGHTEGAVDIVRLAGLKPAAVIGEVMNPDGSMAHGAQLTAFATKHQLTMLSIDDIIAYRLRHEDMIADQTTTMLPLFDYGTFKMTVIKEKLSGDEHVILQNNNITSKQPPLVRIHSSCLTGDLFASERCDCHSQLHYSLDRISKEGGMLIYLRQEGCGIGLFNKINAYALQEQGYDTVEANIKLGFPADQRNYHIAANILRNYNMLHIRLLTNNPNKISDLNQFGIPQVEREAMPSFQGEHNQCYLKTKAEKLNHVINF